MYIPSMQLVSNAAIGTIIGAVLKMGTYNQALLPPPGDNNYQPPVYWLNSTIPFTAVTQEVYEMSAEATQHAVETGAVLSDHVILKPLRVEMEFEVSNYDGLGKNAKLAKTALNEALILWMNRKWFTLITTHRSLDNMLCLHVRAINEASSWGRLAFRATFQQIKQVSLSVASFPAEKVQGALGTNAATNAATFPGGPVTPKSAVSASSPIRKAPLDTPLSDIFSPLFVGPPSDSLTPLLNQGGGGR